MGRQWIISVCIWCCRGEGGRRSFLYRAWRVVSEKWMGIFCATGDTVSPPFFCFFASQHHPLCLAHPMHPLVHYTQTIESSHTHLHSQSLTPGPNQSQENIFNSGSSCGDTSNMSSAPSNVGADIPSQGSFDIGVRGFGGLSHQGFRLEQSAFLVKKIVSREGLDDERRCHAHEYHAVCLTLVIAP